MATPFAKLDDLEAPKQRIVRKMLDQRRFASTESADSLVSSPSLAELTWPADQDAIAANVLAGLISGLKVILGMVTFANIVFNSTYNPSINALFTTGINLNMMGAVVGIISSAIFSDMNALVSPQDVPSMVLSQFVPHIVQSVSDEKMAGPTLLAAGWISTLLTGSAVLILGRLEASHFLRKLPSSVVGGFMAATGAIGIRSSISMLTGAPFYILWPSDFTAFGKLQTWAHLGLALYSLVSIRYLGTWVKPYITSKKLLAIASPLCLLSPILVFYFGLLCRGFSSIDFDWLHEVGWLFRPSPSRPFYHMWSDTLRIDLVDWSLLLSPSSASSIIVLSGLTSLSGVLSIVGTRSVVPCASNAVDGVLGGKVDLDKELTVLGCAQLLVGALTGFPGYQQVGLSANLYLFGGTHRLAAFVCAGSVAAVMISGIEIAAWVPKFFLGAVFLNLGMSFCKTHLVDNWYVMDGASYCAMLLIVFVGLWQDLTKAVAVGVVIEIILTVKQASSINPVYQCGSSDGGFISSRIRRVEDASRLRWGLSSSLEVVRLQGPLFFGNAPTLEDDVTSLIQTSPKLSHFIVDMTRVTQVDDSGARALASVAKFASPRLRHFSFAGANTLVRTQFEKLLDQPVNIFDSLEDVLELCEDDLLEGTGAPQPWPTPPGLSEKQWEVVKEASGQELQLLDGELLFDFGCLVDGVWLLIHGELTMETKRAATARKCNQVSAKYTAPTVIGNSGFFVGAKRHAFRIRAGAQGATVLWLRQADLDSLKSNDLSTYIAFVTKFLGYWMAVEANHLRWRCALNQ